MLDELVHLLQFYLVIPLHILTSATGVVTNILNMIIFFKLGLSNSMSVEIFVLAFTDFFATFVELGMYFCCFFSYLYPYHDVDLWSVGYVTLGWIAYPAYFISNWIVTLMSLEKCISVAAPFKVKQVFTRTRIVTLIVFIYVFFVGFVSPIYTDQVFTWENVTMLAPNNTEIEKQILEVQVTDKAEIIVLIIDSVCTLSLTFLSQAILIVCTLIMVFSLKSSSKVRSENRRGSRKHSALSSKEKRMIKIAISLSVILTVCYIPRYLIIIFFYTLPDLFLDHDVNALAWLTTTLIISFNFSINIFVYLKLNLKFRQQCLHLFGFEQAVSNVHR